MLLTRTTYAQMFEGRATTELLQPLSASGRDVHPTGTIAIKDYAISGRGLHLYRKLQLERPGVKPSVSFEGL